MIKLIKIGGSLLKEKNTFNLLKNILNNEINSYKNKVILVVSAIGRNNDPYSTDTLKRLAINLNKTDEDYLVGQGEILSSLITASILHEFNPKVIRYNEIGIVKGVKYKFNKNNLVRYLNEYNLLIVPGFIMIDDNNNLVTLERGGSDLSAVLIAKMLNIKEITLYKETGGIMSGDPSLIASPYLIKNISYDDVYLLSKLGAKVIQKTAVKFAKENKIKILVKSLYLDEVGSVIYFNSDLNKYKGVTINDKYIYLIGNLDNDDVNIIKYLMHEYNIAITKIKLLNDFILIEVINGKRNFALNLIHHKFMWKDNFDRRHYY